MAETTSNYIAIDVERHPVFPLVVLAGLDFGELIDLAARFSGACWQADIIDVDAPLTELTQRRLEPAVAAVVGLHGDETLVEVRDLLEAHPSTRFLFLAPELPMASNIRWLIEEHNGILIHRTEDAPSVVARFAALHDKASGICLASIFEAQKRS
jgi:hypothetical protein